MGTINNEHIVNFIAKYIRPKQGRASHTYLSE